MTVSGRKSKSTAQKRSRKYWRILLLLSGFIIIIALIAVIFGGLFWVLFPGNPRFQLKRVEVVSDGWWNNRERVVTQKLGIMPEDNLFDHHLAELKQQAERLPGVARAEIDRIPPDTLRIKITERIPRAFLGSRKTQWVVDENAVVMERKYCLNLRGNLPIILGYNQHSSPQANKEMADLQPALDLIMLTILEFPEFEIAWVDIRDPEKFSFVMAYNGKYLYQVFMPKQNPRGMLTVLRSAIQSARQKGDSRAVVDLTFDGNVVFR